MTVKPSDLYDWHAVYRFASPEDSNETFETARRIVQDQRGRILGLGLFRLHTGGFTYVLIIGGNNVRLFVRRSLEEINLGGEKSELSDDIIMRAARQLVQLRIDAGSDFRADEIYEKLNIGGEEI